MTRAFLQSSARARLRPVRLLVAFAFLTIGLLIIVRAQRAQAELRRELAQVSAKVDELRREQAMPGVILVRHRGSICYIHGSYRIGGSGPVQFSGTGFLVAEGLIATNRHVAEPWFDDEDAEQSIRRGAKPRLERLTAFFPDRDVAVELGEAIVSPEDDVAVLRVKDAARAGDIPALVLAQEPARAGESVVVIGYPMGTIAMVAKAPRQVYRRLALRGNDIATARELAALSLIRPSATQGHLGDVVGDKLLYDAATAHGGSGGPVFNMRGEVIGINAAYLDGFAGGTLGISVRTLRPLINAAQR